MNRHAHRETAARPRARLAAGLLALIASAPAFAGGLQGYVTRDRDTSEVEPPGSGDTTWTALAADGETDIELEPGVNRFWVAFRNVEAPEPKTVTLEWSGPAGGANAQVWSWDGLLGSDRSVRRLGSEWIRHRPSENRYVKAFRFARCPRWERFEFHVIASDDDVQTFTFCCDSMCMTTPRFPPWHPFHRIFAKFGVPGAMTVDPSLTELWMFPRTAPVDPDAPQPFEAPPHTGTWQPEIVPADPDGGPRPLGGVRWVTDGPGLGVDDPFDATITTLGHADQIYDLYLFDAARDGWVRMRSGPDPWTDSFDAYPVGPLAGQGGWEPWDGDENGAGFEVTDETAQSAPHALAIDGADDAVQAFAGYADGQWELSAAIRVPAAMDDVQHVILLNTYPAGPVRDWSLQLQIDGAAGRLADRNSEASLPLVRERWATLRVLVDLDRDEQTVLYDGRHLLTKGWTDGVAEGGARAIAALDLYGTESGHRVLFDDVALRGAVFTGACLLPDGTCADVERDACAFGAGEYLGDAAPCPSCAGDLDGSGDVGFPDLLAVLAAWGGAGGPEDVDGSGVVDFGDLLLVLGAWGQCPESHAWRFATTVPGGLRPDDMHLLFTGTGGTVDDIEVTPAGAATSTHGNDVDVTWDERLAPGAAVTVTFTTKHPDVAFAGGTWTLGGVEIGDVTGAVERE